MAFQGLHDGIYSYPRSAKRDEGGGVFVKTFSAPKNAATFAGVLGRAGRDVYVIDPDLPGGRALFVVQGGAIAPEGRSYVSKLLGRTELDVLALFGVEA